MQNFSFRVLLVLIAVSIVFPCFSQTRTNTEILRQAAALGAEKERALYQQLQTLVRQKGWDMVRTGKNGKISLLVGVDGFGMPLYISTDNNTDAAATIGTNKLWPGGSTGLNLNGSSLNVKDKLAIWDGGKVRNTHVELNGRVVQRDAVTTFSDHSTHVAGTMIASGINPSAKGMSFGQQELVAYDFGNDVPEMFGEAANLLVSNHSYGFNAGWNFNEGANRWEFLGQFGANEDYKFGYYSVQAQLWDSIAYNAPYYLIVKSAGNNRDENGPAVGQPYWRYDATNTMSNAGNRPDGISNNDSYDILSLNSTAKNILLVGAVNPIPSGYSRPSDVVMSSFSSWGPTDDGRIKPDVVADGVNLLSSIATSDNAYAIFSGTSMSSPNASGSIFLLQEYYSQLHGSTSFMRSATLKGLVIHTADEAGPSPGPDYQHGWGLINMARAASVITANNTSQLIQENVLNNAATFSLPVIASGDGKISATLSWTDPKAEFEPLANALNNPARKLVNDLDIVIRRGATTYRPWVLNPASPASAATTGDNILDNVEKVELPDVVPGATYTIEITHKGTLARGPQAYSLIASGVGGQAYCASNPTSTAGARIDSVSFANIQNKNAAGCTSYNNFTGLTGNLQPGQTVPLFIRLNSCDATAVNKVVKVYIDANNDGDFADAGENIATSAVINGNGDFTPNITVPAGLTPGKYTIMRIVMQETSIVADVNPCGTYLQGETQDYRILVTSPAADAGVVELIAPRPGSNCAADAQLVTIRIKNFGTVRKDHIPVSALIKQGATTIATLNEIYPDTLNAGATVVYTFQTPFTANANTTYTITSSTSLAGDQDASNNQNIATVNIAVPSSDPAGTASICNTNVLLKANPATATDVYAWYNSATATTPFVAGSNVTTTNILPTYYLGKNDNKFSIGPATKDVFPSGNYNRFSGNFMQFNNSVPLVIESARLYIGQTNASKKLQFILGRNFNSSNNTYLPEASVTLDIFATDPTPQPGLQPNDPADQGAVFYFNLPVTTTGDHILIISQATTDSASIYRNNGITTAPYPIGIPGIFTFTGNSATYSNPPADYQNFYYFFYNLKLRLAGCPAGNRVAVVPTAATAPVITQTGNVLSSTAASSYQWLKDGSPVPGAIGQSYTPTESGTYKVNATDASGCTLSSNEIVITITAVSNVDPDEIGMIVSPNPTNTGQFHLQLETRTRSNLNISLLNTTGQRVYQHTIPNFIGRLDEQVKPGKLSAGIYYLQVQHDKKMYTRKIVVAQ